MKKDNKKALYENIMTSVAKEVKKALNENEYEYIPTRYTVFQITRRNYKDIDCALPSYTMPLIEDYIKKIISKTDDFSPEDFQDLMETIKTLKIGQYLVTPKFRYGQLLIFASM